MENVFHNNINNIAPAAPKARAKKKKKIIFLHKGRNAIRFPSALQKDKRTGELSSAAFFLSASAETAAEENITCYSIANSFRKALETVLTNCPECVKSDCKSWRGRIENSFNKLVAGI